MNHVDENITKARQFMLEATRDRHRPDGNTTALDDLDKCSSSLKNFGNLLQKWPASARLDLGSAIRLAMLDGASLFHMPFNYEIHCDGDIAWQWAGKTDSSTVRKRIDEILVESAQPCEPCVFWGLLAEFAALVLLWAGYEAARQVAPFKSEP